MPIITATWETDREDHSLRPAWAKVRKTPISTNKLDMVVHVCYFSYARGIGKRISVQGWL
jgi:hypothetical protein